MTVLYLSGPMAGRPGWNHPAFHAAAAQLRAAGFTVLNPADYGLDEKDWAACLRRDLHDVLRAEAVAVLPGWENSRGATLETDVARRLGMPIYPVCELLGEPVTTSKQVGLSQLTLTAVDAETVRAQAKHGNRAYLGNGLSLLERFAGLLEEIGEVAEELERDQAAMDADIRLHDLVQTTIMLGRVARARTYDGGGSLRAKAASTLPFDKTALVKELIQVASVTASWAEWLDTRPDGA